MSYRLLLAQLKAMSPEQLNQTVMLRTANDEFIPILDLSMVGKSQLLDLGWTIGPGQFVLSLAEGS